MSFNVAIHQRRLKLDAALNKVTVNWIINTMVDQEPQGVCLQNYTSAHDKAPFRDRTLQPQLGKVIESARIFITDCPPS